MSDEKPQNAKPHGEPPSQDPQQTPDPNVKPPSLIVVQEGYSPAKETKVPDHHVKAPNLASIQCFEPKNKDAITSEQKDSGTDEK